jgi:exonuclease V gamma subunit
VQGQPLHAVPLPTPARAREALRALVDLAARARREALPFMPKAAWEFAGDADPEKGWRKAAAAWVSERGGEGLDAWVQVALRGAAPFAGDDAVDECFFHLARAVFARLPGATPAAAEAADD